MSGKGSRRRAGANDKAFKAAPWPPESPLLRKLADPCETAETDNTNDDALQRPTSSDPGHD